jgi:hypothetical protein
LEPDPGVYRQYEKTNCAKRNKPVGREGLVANLHSANSLATRRNGIAAEILFYRFAVKKIEAESPVFCGFAAKNALLLYREKSKCRCPALF